MSSTKAYIFLRKRLMFTVIRTPDGSPFVDECWSNNEHGHFVGWSIRLTRSRSLVVGIRGLVHTGHMRALRARLRTFYSRVILRRPVTHVAVRYDHASIGASAPESKETPS